MSMNFDLSLVLIFRPTKSIDVMVLGSSQALSWSTNFRMWCTVDVFIITGLSFNSWLIDGLNEEFSPLRVQLCLQTVNYDINHSNSIPATPYFLSLLRRMS